MIETEASPPLATTLEVEVNLRNHTVRARGRVAHVRELSSSDGSRQEPDRRRVRRHIRQERKTIEEFIASHLRDTDPNAEV